MRRGVSVVTFHKRFLAFRAGGRRDDVGESSSRGPSRDRQEKRPSRFSERSPSSPRRFDNGEGRRGGGDRWSASSSSSSSSWRGSFKDRDNREERSFREERPFRDERQRRDRREDRREDRGEQEGERRFKKDWESKNNDRSFQRFDRPPQQPRFKPEYGRGRPQQSFNKPRPAEVKEKEREKQKDALEDALDRMAARGGGGKSGKKGFFQKYGQQSRPGGPIFKASGTELLSCIQLWFSGNRSNAIKEPFLLDHVPREDRHRVSKELADFFTYFGRLKWQLEKKGVEVSAETMWGMYAILIKRADPVQVGKALSGTIDEARRMSSLLVKACEEGLVDPNDEDACAQDGVPDNVRAECPPYVWQILKGQQWPSSTSALAECIAMTKPDSLHVRINTIKDPSSKGTLSDVELGQQWLSFRRQVKDSLAKQGIVTKEGSFSPLCLRVEGDVQIAATPEFQQGVVEVQDEGSQLAALLVDARPKMQVLDLCAGAGGKSMVLSQTMRNRGALVASDVNAPRLNRARIRMQRAGVSNCERVILKGEEEEREGSVDHFFTARAGVFDRVLIDAPCSGVGSWRRSAERKWRSDFQQSLQRLIALQSTLLERGSGMLRPDQPSRLIYVTCSLLEAENERQISKLLASKSNLRLVSAKSVWESVLPNVAWPCGGQEDFLKLTPAQHDTDGFFVAIIENKQ